MAMNKTGVFCVGLTGGIGSGKTTAANYFAQLGVTVIDADVIAHELTAIGAPGYAAIIAHFGDGLLTPSGALDRSQLRQLIFKDPLAKTWLENTLHPLILQVMREQIRRATSSYCVAVIPLLAETSLPLDFLDRICTIDTPDALRLQWASQRDRTSAADIAAIMAAQASREKRLALADDVILNEEDLSSLKSQVKKLHHQYLQMAAA